MSEQQPSQQSPTSVFRKLTLAQKLKCEDASPKLIEQSIEKFSLKEIDRSASLGRQTSLRPRGTVETIDNQIECLLLNRTNPSVDSAASSADNSPKKMVRRPFANSLMIKTTKLSDFTGLDPQSAIGRCLENINQIRKKHKVDLTKEDKYKLALFALNSQVETINELFTDVLGDQEKDFLNAYRTTMTKVMKEIEGIKKKITLRRFELKRNKKIQSLEERVEWFQNEALYQRRQERRIHAQYDKLKDQNEELKDDSFIYRKALENSKVKQKALKQQMEQLKQTNLKLVQKISQLELQLKEREVTNFKNQVILRTRGQVDIDGEGGNANEAMLDIVVSSNQSQDVPFVRDLKDGRQVCLDHKPEEGFTDETGIRSFIEDLLDHQGNSLGRDDLVDQIELFLKLKINKCNQLVDSFRQRLAKLQKENKNLLLQSSKMQTETSSMREIFEECLQQIRADRKTREDRNAYGNESLLNASKMQGLAHNDTVTQGSENHSSRFLKQSNQSRKRLAAGWTRKEIEMNSTVTSQRNCTKDEQTQDLSTLVSNRAKQNFGVDPKLEYPISSTSASTLPGQLKPFERRQLIESFLNHNEVLSLLSEQIFSPASTNKGMAVQALIEQRQKQEASDLELQRTRENEELLALVVKNSGRTAKSVTQRTTAQFMTIQPECRTGGNNSTFFVTAQEHQKKKEIPKPETMMIESIPVIKKRDSIDLHASSTFNATNPLSTFAATEPPTTVNSPPVQPVPQFATVQHDGDSTLIHDNIEEVVNESVDEVKPLIEVTLNKVKPVRPQSSRPVRTNFLTNQALNRQMSSIPADFDSAFDITSPQNQGPSEEMLQSLGVTSYKGASKAFTSRPGNVPKPSLIKGHSDFSGSFFAAEQRGLLSTRALKKRELSPRSNKLLMSTHFINRDSTARTTFQNHQLAQYNKQIMMSHSSGVNVSSAKPVRKQKQRPVSSRPPMNFPAGFKHTKKRVASAKQSKAMTTRTSIVRRSRPTTAGQTTQVESKQALMPNSLIAKSQRSNVRQSLKPEQMLIQVPQALNTTTISQTT